MHFEILVEDASGKKALDILVPKILSPGDTYRVHSYKGIGHIPRNLGKKRGDPAKRILLDNLPRLLRGYGHGFKKYPAGYEATVVVVCDLDDKKESVFRHELQRLLDACHPKPKARFCLAIEEGEAWLLGDVDAILAAYPKARKQVLHAYVNDSICGTWECLANALYPGGAGKLADAGWRAIGREKHNWAEKICPFMVIENNKSPSFKQFVGIISSGDAAC